MRYNSFSTTVVDSAAASTACAGALAESGVAAIAVAGAGVNVDALDAEVEAISAGVSGSVFFFGAKYCSPRNIRTKTTEKMRRVRESCPPPPG
jgi:hypothetical protein